MKFILLICLGISLFGMNNDVNVSMHHPMSVKEKKKRFITLLLPAVQKVHAELMQKYKEVAKVKTDEELLARLKPHPVSITLAQAAIESAWGTSRFFKEANNVFGMWSTNKDQTRIAASEKRGGKRTIWLRKFKTIEDSIRAYYKMIAQAKAYERFRQLRLKYDDPYKITPGLNKYSELGDAYVKLVNQVIKHNNFTQYDKK